MMGSRTLLLNMCRMTPLFIRQSALPCSKILVNRPIGGVRYYSGGVGVDISIKVVHVSVGWRFSQKEREREGSRFA